MGRSLNGSDAFAQGADIELPEHPAQVSAFYLDTFEVTVARFRPFVQAYPDSLPKDGQGAHPKKPGTGWQSAWLDHLPKTRAEFESYDLACMGTYPPPSFIKATYTAEPGPFENYPINCIDWYVAFAFCVWEGGRLPTEAEWEYAAAGGDENRLFPWGSKDPGWPSNDRACMQTGCLGKYGTLSGVGRWGNFDLAGSMLEWVLDTLSSYPAAPCADCIVFDFDPAVPKNLGRGGAFDDVLTEKRATWRAWGFPSAGHSMMGFRCARSP